MRQRIRDLEDAALSDAVTIEQLHQDAREVRKANDDTETGLRRAIESRDVIGQAKGIVMHTLGVDADEAFEVLVKLSQSENRKLHDVAADIARRGTLR